MGVTFTLVERVGVTKNMLDNWLISSPWKAETGSSNGGCTLELALTLQFDWSIDKTW